MSLGRERYAHRRAGGWDGTDPNWTDPSSFARRPRRDGTFGVRWSRVAGGSGLSVRERLGTATSEILQDGTQAIEIAGALGACSARDVARVLALGTRVKDVLSRLMR